MKPINLGVAYPACNLPDNDFLLAKEKLQNYAINLEKSTHAEDIKQIPYRYSPKNRAKEIESLFLDKNIHAIICARGGYGVQHILKYLNFDIIKNNPKPFIGYSDISILLNEISKRTSLVTQHGPMVKELAQINDDNFFQQLKLNILNNFNSPAKLNFDNCETIKEGVAEGILVGGNLSSLVASTATPYEINFKNKILFLEDTDEEYYHIDRLLSNLCDSKKIYDSSAIIFGDFNLMECKKLHYNISLKELILSILTAYKKPILWGLPVGHQNYKNYLPIGRKINLSLTKNKKEISFL